jgi:hypothetical protein
MKTLLALSALVLLTGCNTVHYKRTAPDKTVTQVDCYRFIWFTGKAMVKLGEDTLTIEKSSPDAETAGAIAEGAARGASPLPKAQ